jgi:LysM repeat protein
MDNNDSIKPDQTGGLKLMTVFIAVLALHVLVIGGFTVYHLMSSSGGDAELALDKNHKLKADGTVVATDNPAPDATGADKAADAANPPAPAAADTGSATVPSAAPTPSPAPGANETASNQPKPAAPTPAPATANTPTLTPNSTAPAQLVISGDDMAQTSTIPAGLAPPPDNTPAPVTPDVASDNPPAAQDGAGAGLKPLELKPATAPAPQPLASNTPSGPVPPAGPVHMPANAPPAPVSTDLASAEEHGPLHEKHVTAPSHGDRTLAHDAKHEIYTVKITDSYKKIALAHHVTVAELKEANHIHDDVLHTGQKLIIPTVRRAVAKSSETHQPDAGMTLETASLSASPDSATTTHHRHIYTVAKGDTLSKIAHKFNVSASAIEEANELTDTKLAIGQKLRIPAKETRSADNTAPAGAPVQPSPVQTPPAPAPQPAPATATDPTPMESPAPAPQPAPAASPELANLTF